MKAFHSRKRKELPEFYHREYERMLGPFAELLPRSERSPCLDAISPTFTDGASADPQPRHRRSLL